MTNPIPKPLGKIEQILLVIGGLNWGLAIVEINLVEIIANAITLPIIGTIIYALVGISAIISVIDVAMTK